MGSKSAIEELKQKISESKLYGRIILLALGGFFDSYSPLRGCPRAPKDFQHGGLRWSVSQFSACWRGRRDKGRGAYRVYRKAKGFMPERIEASRTQAGT